MIPTMGYGSKSMYSHSLKSPPPLPQTKSSFPFIFSLSHIHTCTCSSITLTSVSMLLVEAKSLKSHLKCSTLMSRCQTSQEKHTNLLMHQTVPHPLCMLTRVPSHGRSIPQQETSTLCLIKQGKDTNQKTICPRIR